MPPCGRAARPIFTSWVLILLVAAPQSFAQSSSFDDLLDEFAAAVAAALTANEQARIVKATAEAPDLRERLARRGLAISDDQNAAVVIAYSCTRTVRERVCVADVRRGENHHMVAVQRPRGAFADDSRAAPLVLEARPLVGDAVPILDAVAFDTRLLVLVASSVARYDRTDHGWRMRDAKPIVARTPWPRDLRGRLIVDRNGFDAFLPGVGCRGTIDPLTISCGEEQRPWPVGVDNRGIAPSRNYFSLADNRSYYAFAPLVGDTAARVLAATQDASIVMLDGSGAPLGPPIARGDDVSPLATACAPGSHVVLTGSDSDSNSGSNSGGDTLRLFRVSGRDLTPVTPPVVLTGAVTALWPAADASSATVVSHNASAGRYEAFQLRVACGR